MRDKELTLETKKDMMSTLREGNDTIYDNYNVFILNKNKFDVTQTADPNANPPTQGNPGDGKTGMSSKKTEKSTQAKFNLNEIITPLPAYRQLPVKTQDFD